MKNKERIAILESEISRLKVMNRNTNERLEAIEAKLGIERPKPPCSAITDALNNLVVKVERQRIKPEAPECVANKCAPNEGHLREHIDNFFNPIADNAIKSFEAKIMQEFGEMKSGEPKQVNREDINAEMFKIMRNTYNVRNLKASMINGAQFDAIIEDESITPDFIPDWKDAPEDAVCVAMDKDGQWCWYDHVPPKSISVFGLDGTTAARAGNCTNIHLLPPDYWKGTLMMRPDAISDAPDYTHLLPEGYEFCQEGEHDEFVKVEMFGIEREQPLGFITDYNTFIGKYLPIRKSAPDYSHLLPDGYEFCSEADAEKWVKVEKLPDAKFEHFEIGTVLNNSEDRSGTYKHTHYRPIRPIQYKVTTHEITTAIPDPYQPDWSQAPEGAVAHVYRSSGVGHWMCIDKIGNGYLPNCTQSGYTLPPDLDWKQSLRVKPSK
jgi:hypothetical protein